MKIPKLNGIKKIKRTLYKGRTAKLKQLISIMLIAGILSSGLYFCRYSYMEYAVSRADIALSYPEIAQSRQPDGSRFTYYDFIDDKNIEEAIKIMQENGKYENFTAKDLRDHFYMYSYLDGSAVAAVSSERSEGNDFSYVANEFKITFAQPHDYKNKNIVKKVFTPDYSDEFLKTLIKVNRRRIAEEHGGIDGFKQLVYVNPEKTYDYGEKLKIYRTKIRSIMAYINALNKKDSGFVSDKHNMSLQDVNEQYRFLISDKLDGISNFIESSGLSKDTETAVNKLNINIENNTLKHAKNVSASYVNNYAMTNYDHTFTENLINVVRNDDYGLYQARPKTAFDSVVDQKHEADENVAVYSAEISQLKTELAKHMEVSLNTQDYDRLITKCEVLIADFEKSYNALSELAVEIITEYHNDVNENYISSKVTRKNILSKKLLVKMGVIFVLGAVLAFVAFVFINSVNDSKKIKRKKRLINEIKKGERGIAK